MCRVKIGIPFGEAIFAVVRVLFGFRDDAIKRADDDISPSNVASDANLPPVELAVFARRIIANRGIIRRR